MNTLVPEEDMTQWGDMVLADNELGLESVLSEVNKAVQGIDRGGSSVVTKFKFDDPLFDEGNQTKCEAMHDFR